MPDPKTTTYESSTVHRSSERDVYDGGCVADSRNVLDCYGYPFTAPDPAAFIKELAEHFGVKVEEVETNVCDEPGRVEVSRMERIDGEEPTDDERERWKRGEFELWYMTYTVYPVKVIRETVAFPD